MNITVLPSQLEGEIKAITSKSTAHRQLICAALSKKSSQIECSVLSDDIFATANCLKGLGNDIKYKNGIFFIQPTSTTPDFATVDCKESGSTLRFLLPIICALGIKAEIKMSGRLPKRPLSPLWEELINHGAQLSRPEDDKILVSEKLRGGAFHIKGDISSQFITGLLFALPLMKEKSCIEISGELQSQPYIDITRSVMAQSGIKTEFKDNIFHTVGSYDAPKKYYEDGDWSNGAFWICSDFLSKKNVSCTGLDINSPQGDKKIIEILQELKKDNSIIDAKNIPDLIPIISIVAGVSPGETKIINGERLRMKESDRLHAIKEMITALDGICIETDDGLIIKGISTYKGGTVNSVNDHRIAMSAAIAATVSEKKIIINDALAVKKSYPDFWEDFKKLGGNIERSQEK